MNAFFQKLVNLDQNMVTLVLLVIVFMIEQWVNRPSAIRKTGMHFLHGVPLQAGYMAISYGLALMLVSFEPWVKEHHIGLFYQVPVNFAVKVLIGLLCIDFTFYWAHRLYHTWWLPWKLHRVHHSDTAMDGSTFLRFHPFDAILDTFTGMIAIAVFGLDISILLLFFLINLVINILQHSNIIYPAWTDSLLGKVWVTPNIHKVHHHQDQQFTDSNYGQVFIFWDKLFGTYRRLPVQEIKYGLKEFDDPAKQTAWYLLKSPFLTITRINNTVGNKTENKDS